MSEILSDEAFEEYYAAMVRRDMKASADILRASHRAQAALLDAAIENLQTLMDNNPSREQVMKYLQEYDWLNKNMPRAADQQQPDGQERE